MKKSVLLCVLLAVPAIVLAQEIDRSLLRGYDAALMIHDRATGAVLDVDPVRSAQRLPPCSTFKIYNTLIGLELGLLKGADEPWYTWDKVTRDFEGWNKDLTLREAFRVSAVPAYQILARRIGADRMKAYLARIGYGTQDISAGIDIFWLARPGTVPILISAGEQVALLDRLLDGTLPFAPEHVAILREVMEVSRTEKGTLYGKTGSGMGADGKWSLGWFVGFLERGTETYVFACNITGGAEPSGKVARSIVEDVLRSRGLL
jgi:beta-lactamase class D